MQKTIRAPPATAPNRAATAAKRRPARRLRVAGLPEGAGRSASASSPSCAPRATSSPPTTPAPTWWWSTPAGSSNSAKQESLDAIGEAVAKNGRVVVTGCFGVEKERILAAHPGVLAVTGPHQYEQVVAAVHEAVPPLHDPFVDLVPPEGLRLTPRHYAYLKISEGCNNRCSFCIIPQLRGELASRPAAHVMAEAERLVQAGVKELLVISQDTSAYGLDIKYAESRWKGRPLEGALPRSVRRRWARSAPGCACTTSIPTRMSTTCCR